MLSASADTVPHKADYVENQIIIKFHKPVADTLEIKPAEDIVASELKLSASLDKLNKKYRLRKVKPLFKNFRKNRQRLKALLKKDKALLTKKEKHILRRLKRAPKGAKVPELDRIYKIDLDLEAGQSLEDVVAAYNNDPDVEYAELNYIVSICKTPNDPLYPVQWPLNNTGQIYPDSGRYNPPPGTADCDIDAPEAWEIHTGSLEVIIAVVDTGVDYTHRDLDDNIWVNETELNGAAAVDDDGNGYVDDIYGYDFCTYGGQTRDPDPIDDDGHGTHCAGIIAAEGDNGLDIAGLCWDAKIMALKFLDSGGSGWSSDAVEAFYYAVENGADVISNSWGGGDYLQSEQDAIDYAHSQGVIMVASAGNNNSTTPQYPAYYDNMISVAATDSNDQKASFSTYGDWVDIAAPGVDVLSLRANETSMGTVYDNYTTIASGTSMACPHIAGACAFILSLNPFLTPDEVLDTLMGTVDPITPEVCGSGRLNLFSVVLAAVPSQGIIEFDNDFYSCSSVVYIQLTDYDLKGQGSHQVTLATNEGDSETVLLTEITSPIGIFTGIISVVTGGPNTEDGVLQVTPGEIITATYDDSDDGTGNPATVTDTAQADCEPPVIFNLQVDAQGPEPTVTFETDEPSITRVLCGPACGGPYEIVRSRLSLATSHTIKLDGVFPETDYYFIIEATDRVGNVTVDDNAGLCYMFTTDAGPRDIYVPDEYPTIQGAIDISWNGGTVWVADGIYTGQGNRDIDFRGKAVTVKSENGPENCIIDCEGTEAEQHRGFYFDSGEDHNSILDGFTITDGNSYNGGGIISYRSSPTIRNCIISRNSASHGGGMYSYKDSNPVLINCTFSGNSAVFWGGGVESSKGGSLTLIDCTFSGNSATDGGGLDIEPDTNSTLIGCSFIGNAASNGGGMFSYYGSSTITNCTFKGNTGEGVYNYHFNRAIITNSTFTENSGAGMRSADRSETKVTNCIFRGNSEEGMHNGYRCIATVTNCIFSGNGGYGMSGYGNAPATVINCTFSGNGGGVYSYYRTTIVTNCIFWDNGGVDESSQICNGLHGAAVVNYSCIQGWTGNFGGIGNIGEDPLFVEADGADNIYGTDDDNLRLLSGSPCLDAGDNDAVPPDTTDLDADGDVNEPIPLDLDGNPRFIDEPDSTDTGNGASPIVDMGAYEGINQGFLLSTKSVTVPEGHTAAFTVALAMDPLGTVEVTVIVESGDSDITIESGAVLTFDPSNYFQPQTVTLAAAEDGDYFNGTAVIEANAPAFPAVRVIANELDDDAPVVLYVDANAAGLYNGVSWTDAFTSLQEAFTVASVVPRVNEIRVAPGVYKPAGAGGDRGATFRLINGIALYGGYAGLGAPDPNQRDIEAYKTILSGDLDGDDDGFANNGENSYHVVTGNGTDETTVLDGFTITAGNANGNSQDGYADGGGMYNYESNPTITSCTFSGNSAAAGHGKGGGIYNYNSSPILTNCTITENVSGTGGGIYNYRYSNPILTNCTISCNTTNGAHDGGGGICCNYYSSPTISNCIISNNTSHHHGGGIYCKRNSNPTITNCLIIGNTAESTHISGGGGGGIYGGSGTIANCIFVNNTGIWSGGGIYGGSPTITNCLFIGNSAQQGPGTPTSDGGAICDCGGAITNCTIFGNSAAKRGGGLYNCNGPITNCIIWQNTAETGPQLYDSPTLTYSCIQDWTEALGGTDNIGADPLFVDAGNGDYHLLPYSPCIDAGDPNYIAEPNETDLAGNPRVINGRIDMGAYEADYIQARLWLFPKTINRNSRLRNVMAWIHLPQDITEDQIDTDQPVLLYPGAIEPVRRHIFRHGKGDNKRVSIFTFYDKADLMTAVPDNGPVDLEVIGSLNTGQYFYGSDTVRMIGRRGHRRSRR